MKENEVKIQESTQETSGLEEQCNRLFSQVQQMQEYIKQLEMTIRVLSNLMNQ